MLKIGQLFILLLSLFVVQAEASDDSVEQQILKTMSSIQNLQLNEAIKVISNLTQQHPNYRAAQLLKANLLRLKSGQSVQLNPVSAPQDLKQIKAFKKEVAIRWQFNQNHDAKIENTKVDDAVVMNAKSGYFVMIDAKIHRLFLYRQTPEGLERVDDFYVSIAQKGTGKQKSGDLKTPIGIYWINSWKSASQLPDLYGAGALTLNYPNALDKQQGKTGHGIWLHGTPSNTYTRPPLTSKGCVVLTNDAIRTLHQRYQLPAHTPVMIFNQLPSVTKIDKTRVNAQLLTALKKKQIAINWASLTIVAYPGQAHLFYVTYQTKAGEQEEIFWHEKKGLSQSLVESKVFPATQKQKKIPS